MITKKTWEEFRSTGLLWFINQTLHLFGWAIVIEYDDSDPEKIIEVYPARVKFRGFGQKSIDRGYRNVSKYLKDNIDELLSECEPDENANE